MTRDWEAETREAMRHAAEPLALLVAEIGKEIETKAEELKALNASLREANAALARLVPQEKKEKPKNGNSARSERAQAARVEAVKTWLLRHPQTAADGFTATMVAEAFKAEPNGHMRLSAQTATKAIDDLREQGFLVADRVTRGGGMQYKVVPS